ncbi:MAG: hypothetical protein GF311_17470 [Candidatus Lokiarchaeota archaeon]|nr:hypothetical protein [Candidatus Lokiarchaeota archaeon]
MIHNKLKYNFEIIPGKLTSFEKTLLKLEQIRYIENPKRFYRESAYLKRVDGKISYYYLFSKIKSNNFNRGSDYLTHGIDFYRGSFHAQMVRGLINYCNLKDNSKILDPFCGSGTTLVEAALLGFNSIGIDINPIACLNSIIKTGLLKYNNTISRTTLEYDLKYFNNEDFSNQKFNIVLKKDFEYLLGLFIYTRILSMEKRLNMTKETAYTIVLDKLNFILKKYNFLKKRITINEGESKILFNDNLSQIKTFPNSSFDAIITSPPYLNLIDYIEEDINKIKYLFNEWEIQQLKTQSIGNRILNNQKSHLDYWNKIMKIIEEMYRILKNNSFLVFIIGNYGSMRSIYLSHFENSGFFIERILKRKIVNIKKKDNFEYVFFARKKS